jgi:PhzF family phenazine biosynthesis protein
VSPSSKLSARKGASANTSIRPATSSTFDISAPETAYARFFNPTVGLWEDAATGTAAGPLVAYLASEGLLKNNELAIEQGTKMGRRSILRVRITPAPELSGTGIVVLRGVIRL